MQIMTVLGSPRRRGNTAKVLGWIEEQFQADGHQVDRANILDYRVQGCGECMACKKGTSELCSIGDDANGLYRRMVAADLVLRPVHYGIEWAAYYSLAKTVDRIGPAYPSSLGQRFAGSLCH